MLKKLKIVWQTTCNVWSNPSIFQCLVIFMIFSIQTPSFREVWIVNKLPTLFNLNNKIMQHLFIPYELALKLKEKGFDEPCLGLYFSKNLISFEYANHIGRKNSDSKINNITAPLYQQVIDWFREKHKIHIAIVGDDNYQYQFEINTWSWYELEKTYRVGHRVLGDGTFYYLWHARSESFKSYYEALNKAIEEALKLI